MDTRPDSPPPKYSSIFIDMSSETTAPITSNTPQQVGETQHLLSSQVSQTPLTLPWSTVIHLTLTSRTITNIIICISVFVRLVMMPIITWLRQEPTNQLITVIENVIWTSPLLANQLSRGSIAASWTALLMASAVQILFFILPPWFMTRFPTANCQCLSPSILVILSQLIISLDTPQNPPNRY